jgi:lysylphosphatidylglycerol synthetase-like protein (DUF2156 family)
MLDAIWGAVVVVVLVGVALLFIADALQQRTVPARIAAFLTLGAGVLLGAELLAPWLPLAVLALAFCLGVAGRLGSDDTDTSATPPR